MAASIVTRLLCFTWDTVRPQSFDACKCRTAVTRQRLCLHIFRAVEGDDWSSVIDGQTAETIADSNPVDDTHQYPIATPFARASVHRSIGDSSQCLSAPSHVRWSVQSAFCSLLACRRGIPCLKAPGIWGALPGAQYVHEGNCTSNLQGAALKDGSLDRMRVQWHAAGHTN